MRKNLCAISIQKLVVLLLFKELTVYLHPLLPFIFSKNLQVGLNFSRKVQVFCNPMFEI